MSVSALSSPKMPLDKANTVINERGHLGVRAAVTRVLFAMTSVVIVLAIQQLWHRVHTKYAQNESEMEKLHVGFTVWYVFFLCKTRFDLQYLILASFSSFSCLFPAFSSCFALITSAGFVFGVIGGATIWGDAWRK